MIKKFLILFGLTMLLTACHVTIGRQKDWREPVSMLWGSSSSLYKLEIWSAHEQYEFNEPVHLRATVTNNSKKELTAELDAVPIINIVIGTQSPTEAAAERIWSQEHPDEVRYSLALAPGESYVIEWTLVLEERGRYLVDLCSSGCSSSLTCGNRRCGPGIGIYYGVNPPEEAMP